jgi:hypothetical protein
MSYRFMNKTMQANIYMICHKVRSFLQAVWFDGIVTCIAMSKSSVATLLVPMTMMLVSVVCLVGGVVDELSYPTTLSILQEKS